MNQIDELKKILVGDNAEQLSELKQRIEDVDKRTDDVVEVLVPAIKKGIAKNNELSRALESPVTEGLKQAIRREPAAYADILYPVMSPAIRLAISQAMSSLLSTINQTIESATSLQGIKTRFEGIRTGVPYAELALRRSLLFRVEHVFLIERDTGLLISELQNNDVNSLDSDAVSAMFSAIQSFVQDSFSQNDQDRLTDVTVGEHKVWVTHGPKAMLACVIRGDAPASLRSQLHDVLDRIRIDYAEQLAHFDGDNSEFIDINEALKPCLQLQLKENSTTKKTAIGTLLFMGLLVLALAYGLFKWFDNKQRLNNVRQLLNQTPGLVVTDTFWDDEKLVIQGLKDPLVEVSTNALMQQGVEESDLTWDTKPFQSLEAELVVERMKRSLNVPESVDVKMNQFVLSFQGEADMKWLSQIQDLTVLPLGVEKLDLSKLTPKQSSLISYVAAKITIPKGTKLTLDHKVLSVKGAVDLNWTQQLKGLFEDSLWVSKVDDGRNDIISGLTKKINQTVIMFEGKSRISNDAELKVKSLIRDIKQLLSLYENSDNPFKIELFGNSDGNKESLSNKKRRKQRAQLLKDKIESAVSNSNLVLEIIENEVSLHDERSARLHVVLPK